jgi:hypothetical protein
VKHFKSSHDTDSRPIKIKLALTNQNRGLKVLFEFIFKAFSRRGGYRMK